MGGEKGETQGGGIRERKSKNWEIFRRREGEKQAGAHLRKGVNQGVKGTERGKFRPLSNSVYYLLVCRQLWHDRHIY